MVDSILANHHSGNLNFDVIAIPGAKVATFLSLLRKPVSKGGVDLSNYAFVAWLVGTNDLHQWVLARHSHTVRDHRRHAPDKWIPDGHVEREHVKLISLVRSLSPVIPIHIFSILPRMLDFEQSEEQRQRANAQLEQICLTRSREAPCLFHDIGRYFFDRRSRLKSEMFALFNRRQTRDEIHLAPRAKYYTMKLVRAKLPKCEDVHVFTRRTKDGTLRLRESVRLLSC